MTTEGDDYFSADGATEMLTVATAWPFAVTTVMVAVSEPLERMKSRRRVPAEAIADAAPVELAAGTAVKPWSVRTFV